MGQEVIAFWSDIKKFSFENFLDLSFYTDFLKTAEFWHLLLLLALFLIIIANIIKIIFNFKVKNNLILSKLIGKIYWWVSLAGILFMTVILFSYYRIPFFGWRIYGILIILFEIFWAVIIVKWIRRNFQEEYLESLKLERIEKYQFKKRKK